MAGENFDMVKKNLTFGTIITIIAYIVSVFFVLFYLVFASSFSFGRYIIDIFHIIVFMGFVVVLLRQRHGGLNTAICSLVFIAFFVEYFLSLSAFSHRFTYFLKSPHDTRTVSQVISEYRRDGKVVYPSVTGGTLRAIGRVVNWKLKDSSTFMKDGQFWMPFGGISGVETVLCSEAGDYTVYKADRYGFRNPDAVWDRRLNVVVTGDSFTHGRCVNQDLADILRRESGLNVVNLGMSATSILLQWAAVQEYTEDRKPDFVVIFFTANDVKGFASEEKAELLIRYVKDPEFRQGLIERSDEVRSKLIAFIDNEYQNLNTEAGNIIRRQASRNNCLYIWMPFCLRTDIPVVVYLKYIAAMMRLEFTKTAAREMLFGASGIPAKAIPAPDSGQLSRISNVMEGIRDRVNQWGGKLVIVYLPLTEAIWVDPDVDPLHSAIKNTVLSLDIDFIDAFEMFHRQGDVESLYAYGKGGGHYSQKGYDLIGREVANFLKPLIPR